MADIFTRQDEIHPKRGSYVTLGDRAVRGRATVRQWWRKEGSTPTYGAVTSVSTAGVAEAARSGDRAVCPASRPRLRRGYALVGEVEETSGDD